MWAWNRIDRLQKEADGSGSGRQAAIPEIVRLGEGYSIVTEYTSFLVLENDGEYKRWKIDRRNALRVGRDRASQARVAEQLAKLREKSESVAMIPEERTLTLASAPAQPRQSTRTGPSANPGNVPTPSSPAPSAPRRSHDVSFDGSGGGGGGGGGGAGAIDPVSALALLGLGTVGILAKRGGRREKEK
jgi:hypothetical protein